MTKEKIKKIEELLVTLASHASKRVEYDEGALFVNHGEQPFFLKASGSDTLDELK